MVAAYGTAGHIEGAVSRYVDTAAAVTCLVVIYGGSAVICGVDVYRSVGANNSTTAEATCGITCYNVSACKVYGKAFCTVAYKSVKTATVVTRRVISYITVFDGNRACYCTACVDTATVTGGGLIAVYIRVFDRNACYLAYPDTAALAGCSVAVYRNVCARCGDSAYIGVI